MVARYDEDTAVQHLGGGRYGAVAADRWRAYLGPNGGYLGAIILNACTDVVNDPDRRPRSLSLHFLEPATFGPAEVDVTVERAGRSMTTLSGRLSQLGRTKVLAVASYSRDRVAGEYHDAVMPRVPPPPADVPPGSDDDDRDRMAIVHVLGGASRSGQAAEAVGWVRLRDPRMIDEGLAVVYLDGWYPTLSVRLEAPTSAPTSDLTIHFRAALPPPGAGADDWYLLHLRSRVAADGFAEEDGDLWSQDGRLLVQARQLQVILK